jgi:hypothetical protein
MSDLLDSSSLTISCLSDVSTVETRGEELLEVKDVLHLFFFLDVSIALKLFTGVFVLQDESSHSGYLGGDEGSLNASTDNAGLGEESGTEDDCFVKVHSSCGLMSL